MTSPVCERASLSGRSRSYLSTVTAQWAVHRRVACSVECTHGWGGGATRVHNARAAVIIAPCSARSLRRGRRAAAAQSRRKSAVRSSATQNTAQRWARISVQQSTLQLPSTEYTTTPHTTAYSTRSVFPFPARHDVTTEYRHYTSVHRSVRYPRSLCSWFVVDLLSLERGLFSLHSPRSGFRFAAVVDPPCGGRACVRVNVSLTRMRACVRYAHR